MEQPKMIDQWQTITADSTTITVFEDWIDQDKKFPSLFGIN